MSQINELIESLENFARENEIVEKFLEIFKESGEERRKKWEKFKNEYCAGKKQCRVEDILKKQLKEYLEGKLKEYLEGNKYRVRSDRNAVKLDAKFFEVNTYTDLKVDLNGNTTVFIELKLNYPPKGGNGSSYKKWGYEEFISLKEKFDIVYVNQDSILILFIIDAVVRRRLEREEIHLLRKAEHISVRIVRIFLDDSGNFDIERI